MAYNLASLSVLLGCGGEGHKRCGLEVGLCGSCSEDTTSISERNELDAEICDVGFGAGVISRAYE